MRTDVGVLGRFSMRITIAGLLLLLASAASLLFVFLPDARDELVFVVSVLGGTATVYSAFYIGAGLRSQLHNARVAASFDIFRDFNSVEFIRLRNRLQNEFDPQKTKPSEAYGKITASEELHTAVKALLNHLETISIAVQQGYADEVTLYQCMHTIVPWTIERFAPFITEVRKIYETQTIYSELQRLADSWRHGRLLTRGGAALGK